jgi:uncharacterized membrane protein YdjX (TVP38/TMEM64 family)
VQGSTLRRTARRRLLLLALAIAAAFGAAVALLPHDPAEVARLAALPAPLLAAAAIVAWTLLTPALVSGTLLAAATGLLLGGVAGMPVSLVGATLGAAAAFFVARRLGRGPAQALAGPRLTRLQERVERRPLLTIVLARAAPGSPATILNYAAGLTRIRFRHFVAGSVIGGAPRVLAYTALGGAAAERALWPAIAAVALAGHSPAAGDLLSDAGWTTRSGSTAWPVWRMSTPPTPTAPPPSPSSWRRPRRRAPTACCPPTTTRSRPAGAARRAGAAAC